MENSQAKNSRKVAKVVVQRDLCIGAGPCVVVAPKSFELDAENKAIVLENPDATDNELLLAAQSCPTQAIFLYDKDGNLLSRA